MRGKWARGQSWPIRRFTKRELKHVIGVDSQRKLSCRGTEGIKKKLIEVRGGQRESREKGG